MSTACAARLMSRLQCCKVSAPYAFRQRIEATRVDPETGLRVPDIQVGEETAFGGSVVISADGKVLLVSDIEYNAGADGEFANNGVVYIYDRYTAPCERGCKSAGTKCSWRFRERLFQKDWCSKQLELQQDAGFGASIALSGNGEFAVIGAPFQTAGASNSLNAGAVYLFQRRPATQTYVAVQTLVAQSGAYDGDVQANAYFGSAVGISDDGRVIVVGAPQADGVGAAYVYEAKPSSGIPLSCLGTAGLFVFRQKLASPDKNRANDAGATDASASFGSAVHIDQHGYVVVVSASGTNVGPPSFSLEFVESPASPASPAQDPQTFSLSFVPPGTLIDTGSVFVYQRALSLFNTCTQLSATALPLWALTQRIDHPEPQHYARLGRRSLRITADAKYLVVAAVAQFTGEDGSPNGVDSPTIGAVYLFKFGCRRLYELYQILTPTLDEQNSADLLNTTDSVAISADACTIAVGYAGIDTNSDHTNSGRVIVYKYLAASNDWQQSQIVSEYNADGEASPRDRARFGFGVDLSNSGDTLVAGNYPLPSLLDQIEPLPSYVETFDAAPLCLPKFANRIIS